MLRALQVAPFPVTLLIFSFLCPTELSLFLGGLRLPPHRVALIAVVGFAVVRLLTRRDIRVHSFDLLFLMFNAWTVYAFSVHDAGGGGLVYGGSQALESMGAYLVARVYVRDQKTLLVTLKVMLVAIGAAAAIALPETLLGRNFTHDLLHSLTGYHHPTAVQTRLGLTRAYGTFDHPIHYGTFCAGLFAMFWFSQRRAPRRWGRAVFVAGATFLGISSAPILCFALQGGMVLWERFTRSIPARTAITFAALAGLYIGVALISTRSVFMIVATRLTLDSWTGFYRTQIWEHGMLTVWSHPWLGIGLADWDRPWWMVSPTVDAFWLVIAMRTGIPGFLLIAAAVFMLVVAVASNRRKFKDPMMRRLAKGWLMSLAALCLIAVTVHFWNVLYAYFFFFLGLGGVLADPRARGRRRAPRPMGYAREDLQDVAAESSNGGREAGGRVLGGLEPGFARGIQV